LPTIRLFNEAPHRFLPQNHRRIIAAALRFHTARVINGPEGLEIQLPFHPKERTCA